MHELKTSYIAKVLTVLTNKSCAVCKNKIPCNKCLINRTIKIVDRINDGEPVIDNTRLKQ